MNGYERLFSSKDDVLLRYSVVHYSEKLPTTKKKKKKVARRSPQQQSAFRPMTARNFSRARITTPRKARAVKGGMWKQLQRGARV